MECERSSPTEAGISSQDTGNSHRRTATAARRMYECTFCKRGFTNAQALGGHMNIHRRDRAKAKQNAATTSATPYCSSEEFEDFCHRNPNLSSNRQICSVSDQFRVRRCFPASGSGPKVVDGDEQDVLIGTNLSLRIGSSEKNENFERKRENAVEGDELDLELRLGS